MKRFWLMKSEPDAFSIDDLKKRGTEPWTGVRNYQARNFMRDQMQPGDLAFLYHSSCPQPGIYGVMEIATKAYPDPTQFDKKSPYYDPASTREQPRWHMVDVRYQRHLPRPVLLSELRASEYKLCAPASTSSRASSCSAPCACRSCRWRRSTGSSSSLQPCGRLLHPRNWAGSTRMGEHG
jgi:predicted RNA-binding protein with PUA-like domain